MVSRRKILSRSRDDLDATHLIEDEEDVWFQREKLFKDHVQEVLEKWTQIDDEIWAKIICFEKNRRIAKAYARAPVLTINGSNESFDGYRIGLMGFDNPLRDEKTQEVKKHIGHGVKIKMDEDGNILVKRASKANVYIRRTIESSESNSLSSEILKLPHGALELNKPLKLFDLNKFQHNVSKEFKKPYPDIKKLEVQCISAITFVRNESDLLKCPCWILIINIVAMDILKSKIRSVKQKNLFKSGYELNKFVNDENYNSMKMDRKANVIDVPPKLPPRDQDSLQYLIPKPDYDEECGENTYNETQSSLAEPMNYIADPYYLCYGLKSHNANNMSSKESQLFHSLTSEYSSSSSPHSSSESIYLKSKVIDNDAQLFSPSNPSYRSTHQQVLSSLDGTIPHFYDPLCHSNAADLKWENLWKIEPR